MPRSVRGNSSRIPNKKGGPKAALGVFAMCVAGYSAAGAASVFCFASRSSPVV